VLLKLLRCQILLKRLHLLRQYHHICFPCTNFSCSGYNNGTASSAHLSLAIGVLGLAVVSTSELEVLGLTHHSGLGFPQCSRLAGLVQLL
jgi:hypothetical protein